MYIVYCDSLKEHLELKKEKKEILYTSEISDLLAKIPELPRKLVLHMNPVEPELAD